MWAAIVSFFKKEQKIDNTYYEYMLDRMKGVNYSNLGSQVVAQKTNVYFCFLKQILAPDDYNNKKIDFQNEQCNSGGAVSYNKNVKVIKNIDDFIFIKKTPGLEENLWWLDIQSLPTKKQILDLWDFFKFDLILAYSNYIIIFFWFCIFLFIGAATFDRARTLAIVNLGLFTVLFLIALAYLNYTSKFKNMLQYSFINNNIYKSNTFYCFGRTGSPVILKNSVINANDFLNLTKERLYAATDLPENPHKTLRSDLSGTNRMRRAWRYHPGIDTGLKRPWSHPLYLQGAAVIEAFRDTRAYLEYHFFANNIPVTGTKKGIKTLSYVSRYLTWLPMDQVKSIKINNTPTHCIGFKHLSKIFGEVTLENYKTNLSYLKLKSTATINLWKMFSFNETLVSSSFFLIFFATTIGSIFCFFVYCVGLNGDWQKRRLFFLKPMMYRVNFFKKKNLIKQYFNKTLRKKWGGTGLQEAFSIETSKYKKSVTKPNFKNLFTLNYIDQLKNMFYSRTPTTLIWVSFTLGWFLQPNTTIYYQIIGMILVVLFGVVYLVFRFDFDWKTEEFKSIVYTLLNYKKFKDYLAAWGVSGDLIDWLKNRGHPYYHATQPFSGLYVFFVKRLFNRRFFFWFYPVFSAAALTVFFNLYAVYGELKIPTKEEISFFILLQFTLTVYLLVMKNTFIWIFETYAKKEQCYKYKFILTKIFSIIFYLIYTITACTLFYFYIQCFFFPNWQRRYVEFFYLFTFFFLLYCFFCNKEYFNDGYGLKEWYYKLLSCKHSIMNLLQAVYWSWLFVFTMSFPVSTFLICFLFSHAVGSAFPVIYAYPYSTERDSPRVTDQQCDDYFFFYKTKIYVKDMNFQGIWSENAALLSSFVCIMFLIAMPTSDAKNIFNFHLFQYGLVLVVIYVFLNIYKIFVFKIKNSLLDLIINSFLFIGLSIIVYYILNDFYLPTTSFYILNINPKIILILWVFSILKYWPIFFKSRNYTSSIYFLTVIVPCSLSIFFNLNCYVVQVTPTYIYLLFLWELMQLYKYLNITKTKAIIQYIPFTTYFKKKTTKATQKPIVKKTLLINKIKKLTEINVTTKSWKKILAATTLFFYLTLFSFEISMKLEYNWCVVLYSVFIIISLIISTILFFSISSFLLNGSIQEMQGALTKIRYAKIFYYIALTLYLLLILISVYFIIYSLYYLAI